ncbi:MAG: hypothetical protein ABUS56_08355, partial [Acidobacteriota bacterium]
MAEALSAAAHIEPALLRAMRLALRPRPHVGAEADLWFGPLVEAASPSGFTLRADVARVLRDRLAADATALAFARDVIVRAHAHLPVAVRLQEELIWLGLRPDTAATQERISELWAQTLRMLEVDPQRSQGVARWALRALESAPGHVRADHVGRQVEASARLLVGRPPADDGPKTPWVLPPGIGTTTLGVHVFDGGVAVTADPPAGMATVDVPATNPPVLHVSVSGDPDTATTVAVWPDAPTSARMTEVQVWSGRRPARIGTFGVIGHVVGTDIQRGFARVAVALADGRVELIHLDGQAGRDVIDGIPRPRSVRFAADNQSLILVDEAAAVWQSSGLRPPWRMVVPPSEQRTILDCDGRRLVVLDEVGSALLYDLDDGQPTLRRRFAGEDRIVGARLTVDDVIVARVTDGIIEFLSDRVLGRHPLPAARDIRLMVVVENGAIISTDDTTFRLDIDGSQTEFLIEGEAEALAAS